MSPSFGFNPVENAMFTIMPILFICFFAVIFVVIILSVVKSAKQGIHNSQSPILTVEARILSRRSEAYHSSDADPGDGIDTSGTRTDHYITFEVESGDRMEFGVQGQEFGLLMEGDYGKLTFQGTRFKGFVRDVERARAAAAANAAASVESTGAGSGSADLSGAAGASDTEIGHKNMNLQV